MLGLGACYMDPKIELPRNWARFLRKLHASGVIEYVFVEDTAEKVGCFFVRKNNGDLRLVIDCRMSNCHFEPPDRVQLRSGAA